MDLYDNYETEFNNKYEQLKVKLQTIPSKQGEQKKRAIQEAEKLLLDTRQILQNMEQCAQNATRDRARRLDIKNRNFSNDLLKLKKDLEHASLVNLPLKDDYGEDYQVREIDQRTHLLAGTEKVDQTGERLQSAHRIAIETEQIGASALQNLGSQRQTLESARDNLHGINDKVTQSRTILSAMGRRVITNKLILLFIIVLLLVAIGLIAYFKWIRKLV